MLKKELCLIVDKCSVRIIWYSKIATSLRYKNEKLNFGKKQHTKYTSTFPSYSICLIFHSYAGHKPQYRYQCSETFGACTHRLLLSPDVRQSSCSVLRSIDPPRSHTVPLGFHDVPKVSSIKVTCILFQEINKFFHELKQVRKFFASFLYSIF